MRASPMMTRYAPLPAELEPLAEAAADRLDLEMFQGLSTASRLALYEDWMRRPVSEAVRMPQALAAADPDGYLARAERTLVAGSLAQKLRAVAFLELAASPAALPVLRRAMPWVARRRMPELRARIAEAIGRLEGLTVE